MSSEIDKALQRLRSGGNAGKSSGEKLTRFDQMRTYDAQMFQSIILSDIASLLEGLNENMAKLRRDIETTFPKGQVFGMNPTVGSSTATLIDVLDNWNAKAFSMAIANDTASTTVWYSINGDAIDKTLPVLGNQEDRVIFPKATIERVALLSSSSSSVRVKFVL